VKIKILIFLSALILSVSGSSSAEPEPGTISYCPQAASITIPAGSTATITVNIDIINADPTLTSFYLRPASQMTDGNLPLDWIRASPSWTFMSRGTAVGVVLSITVPTGTASGTYSGHLVSYAMASHGKPDPGKGINITVLVPVCSGAPEIRIDSFGPATLWPPDHSMESVTVSGVVTLPAWCSLAEVGYAIDDEYGIYSSFGPLSLLADKSFTLALPVEAWREGQDKDGRHYNITIYGKDEFGLGSSETLSVLVPHTRGK